MERWQRAGRAGHGQQATVAGAQEEWGRKWWGEGAGLGLDLQHHAKEPRQPPHAVIEGVQQLVTCSRWCLGSVTLGAAAQRTVKG